MDTISSYYKLTVEIIAACNKNQTDIEKKEYLKIGEFNQIIASNADDEMKAIYYQLLYAQFKYPVVNFNSEYRNHFGALADHFKKLWNAEDAKDAKDAKEDESNSNIVDPSSLQCSLTA